MAIIDLEVSPREETGKNANRRLRAEGKIPGVIYGHGDTQKVSVDARVFAKTLSEGEGENSILRLLGAGEGQTVIIREIQRDPVHLRMLHADFGRVNMDEKVRFEIPVHLKGTAPGIKKGGILTQPVRRIEVECTPTDVPNEIVVDVSALDFNEAIHIHELTFPAGVECLAADEEVVVQVLPPRLVKEEEEEEGVEEEITEPELVGKEKKEEEEEEEEEK